MNRIKELRIKNGTMQADLANYIGVAASTLSGYESEKTQADISVYKKIAKFYGVTLDYLFGGDMDPPAQPVNMFPDVTDRFARLSEIDRARVLAYMDGILSGSDYNVPGKMAAG